MDGSPGSISNVRVSMPITWGTDLGRFPTKTTQEKNIEVAGLKLGEKKGGRASLTGISHMGKGGEEGREKACIMRKYTSFLPPSLAVAKKYLVPARYVWTGAVAPAVG